MPGRWLHGVDDKDAKDVYDIYKSQHEEYQDVPFELFEKQHNKAIGKAAERRARSAQEEEWMKHDRLLHPRQTHNHRGELVFDMDLEAKEQLREDIKNKLHKKLDPSELWGKRLVYQRYDLDIFRPRIYQEVRRRKFLNLLEHKRTIKRQEFASKMNPTITFAREKGKKTGKVASGEWTRKRSRKEEKKAKKPKKGDDRNSK